LQRLGKGAFLLGSELSSHRSVRFLDFARRDRVIGEEFCNGVFTPYRARLEFLCWLQVQCPLPSVRSPPGYPARPSKSPARHRHTQASNGANARLGR
jgi:hypothetical protein